MEDLFIHDPLREYFASLTCSCNCRAPDRWLLVQDDHLLEERNSLDKCCEDLASLNNQFSHSLTLKSNRMAVTNSPFFECDTLQLREIYSEDDRITNSIMKTISAIRNLLSSSRWIREREDCSIPENYNLQRRNRPF